MDQSEFRWPARIAIWFGMAFLMAAVTDIAKASGLVDPEIAQFVNGSVSGLTGAWAVKLVQFR